MTYEQLCNEFSEIEKSIKYTNIFLSSLKAIVQNDYPEFKKEDINEFKNNFVKYLNKRQQNERRVRELATKIVRYANTKVQK